MSNHIASGIHMTSLDELLGVTEMQEVQAPIESVGEDKVVRLPLAKLHEFKGHPYRVLDEKLVEMLESIEKYGVLIPGIARPMKDMPGEYEIVAGHCRCRGSELAGLTDMPFIIKNLSDDEAIVIMVDSNIQREDLLPSEKAFAYKMKYDALQRMGRTGEGRNDAKMAKEFGKGRNTIQRYIRLTYLHQELLQAVDVGKMPLDTAYHLSFLKNSEQNALVNVMADIHVIPSGAQAEKLKEFSRDGKLTDTVIQLVLERKEDETKVSLKGKEIRKYFPETYTGKQIESIIFELLEEWQERQKNRL